eukprot:3815896-Amphidinium_carterae.2
MRNSPGVDLLPGLHTNHGLATLEGVLNLLRCDIVIVLPTALCNVANSNSTDIILVASLVLPLPHHFPALFWQQAELGGDHPAPCSHELL